MKVYLIKMETLFRAEEYLCVDDNFRFAWTNNPEKAMALLSNRDAYGMQDHAKTFYHEDTYKKIEVVEHETNKGDSHERHPTTD